jgi:hypothetical protein
VVTNYCKVGGSLLVFEMECCYVARLVLKSQDQMILLQPPDSLGLQSHATMAGLKFVAFKQCTFTVMLRESPRSVSLG